MSEHWFRQHHGTPSDPKWRVVATRAGHTVSRRVTPANVLAVWQCMLDCASQAIPRGELVGWDSEDISALLEIDKDEVDAIYQAMQGKTLDGNRLTAWEKRQPKRERDDPSASSRKVAQRERDKVQNADPTPSHAASHHVTPRGEEKRRDIPLGEGEVTDSRAPETAAPTPRAEIGAATGQIAKVLRTAGITHVNPSHPDLLRLIGSGVTADEFRDAAAEAIANGKRHLAYVCAVITGRRRDAAEAGQVAPKGPQRPVAGSGAHRPYVPERRQVTEGAKHAQEVAMSALRERFGAAAAPDKVTTP